MDVVDWARELRHSWPLLRARSTSEVTTVPLPLTPVDRPVRIGVDGAGARHLLVPLDDEPLRGDDADAVLSLRVRTHTFAGSPSQYLDVFCTRPDLFGQFDEVLVDILSTAAHGSIPAAISAMNVVSRWRALFGTVRSRLLSVTERMGLFAELEVLDLVTRRSQLEITWWRGPLREPHDIVLPNRAIEVKAVGPSATSIEVHGVQQMEPPGVPLALVIVGITEDDHGITLPDRVGILLRRVDDRGEAVRLLRAAGYVDSDAERYEDRFSVRDLALVEITNDVPRIVPESFAGGIPAGLDHITYQIRLDSLDRFAARGESALAEWSGGLA